MDEGKTVEKVWGREVWLTNTPLYCLKQLHVNPGYRCSLHYHEAKDETFVVGSGAGFLQLRDDLYRLREGDVVHVPPRTPHRFFAEGSDPLVLLEVSTHHDDADVVRLRESEPLKRGLSVNEPAPGRPAALPHPD